MVCFRNFVEMNWNISTRWHRPQAIQQKRMQWLWVVWRILAFRQINVHYQIDWILYCRLNQVHPNIQLILFSVRVWLKQWTNWLAPNWGQILNRFGFVVATVFTKKQWHQTTVIASTTPKSRQNSIVMHSFRIFQAHLWLYQTMMTFQAMNRKKMAWNTSTKSTRNKCIDLNETHTYLGIGIGILFYWILIISLFFKSIFCALNTIIQ